MKRSRSIKIHLRGAGLKAWRRTPRSTSRRGSRHLFDRWKEVARQLRRAKSLVLFLDFDGTLTPLRRRPEEVPPLNLRLRRVLRRLASRRWLALYIISGRSLSQLRRLVPVRALHLLGLHGWEQRNGPSMAAERRLVRRAKRLLEKRLPDAPSIWLEDKGLGVAVHYRGAPERAVQLARRLVHEIVELHKPDLGLLEGKKIWEILPSRIRGKGPAVSALLSKRAAHALPIFVGDDATDESAFAVLADGITVRVGAARRTRARFSLRHPDEVLRFLELLEAEIT